MSTDIVNLDRFDGGSFMRWQKKMQFILATFNVAYVLTKPYLEKSKNKTLAESRERLKFGNNDFICRGHILNAMSDPLFDMYQNYPTARELWKALEELLHERRNNMFTQNNMNIDESIQVASIIGELPSTWKDVKKNLKHRKDDLSFKDFGKHLLIEEQYLLENKANDDTSKVHAVKEMGVYSKIENHGYWFEYKGDPSLVEGYTDASWIIDQEDYASTRADGYSLLVGVKCLRDQRNKVV
nr:potassium channel AKT2/3-like [Tanacetum cinerariifolium]